MDGKIKIQSNNTDDLVLQGADKEPKEIFDQELIRIMTVDKKWGEQLPIAQMMKGEYKIGGLRRIKEEDEDDDGEGEEYYDYNYNNQDQEEVFEIENEDMEEGMIVDANRPG